MKTNNENKVNNVKANANNVNNNNAATAKVENVENKSGQEVTSEPTVEQIAAAKVEQKQQKEFGERYTMEAPKEVEVTKFVGAYVLGVYRPTSDRKNSDKTFYKIFFNGKIYDGYSATEFCDTVGIERKHRDCSKSAPKAITLLDKLQALKAAIEAIESTESDFINFAKIVTAKIESEQIESQRADFVAKYGEAIALFDMITEATFAKRYNTDDLALAKKLGYKFSDTTDTTDTTESK